MPSNDTITDDNKDAAPDSVRNGKAAADQLRVRTIIGELYYEQFDILIYLTFLYYTMVTARDVLSAPDSMPVLLLIDAAVLLMLASLYILERRGTVNAGNIYLTPIPIAFAMLINGYTHIFLQADPFSLVKGILMTIAFGIVALLPWIFWLLLAIATAFYMVATVWVLGDEAGLMLGLGVGAAMLSYGSFAMRYNSVRKQIALTIVNEERAKKLEMVGKAKDQFIANISHELRTPLTGLLGMVNLIEEQGLSVEQKEQLSAAKYSAETLGAIIGDLLDVSTLDAGKLELKVAAFDFDETVQSVVSVLDGQAKDGVNLVYSGPASVTPLLLGDASRVRQILFNLIGNALKFTDSGFVKVTVSQVKKGDPVRLRCLVEDTGVGIPASKLAKLFDRFEQVDASSTRNRSGTGLGLAIAQELSALMGSEIQVESDWGKGSRFWFDLELAVAPVAAAVAASAETESSDEAADYEARLAQPLKILIAEDNPVNQMLIGKLLERPNWDLQIVADGRAAVEAADECKFDIILMDIQMPGLTGEGATENIRASKGPNKFTPIIALTANCHETDIERYRSVGFSAHISKPINRPEFYRTIASLLSP